MTDLVSIGRNMRNNSSRVLTRTGGGSLVRLGGGSSRHHHHHHHHHHRHHSKNLQQHHQRVRTVCNHHCGNSGGGGVGGGNGRKQQLMQVQQQQNKEVSSTSSSRREEEDNHNSMTVCVKTSAYGNGQQLGDEDEEMEDSRNGNLVQIVWRNEVLVGLPMNSIIREVVGAISGRLGDTAKTVPSDHVEIVFNDLGLYPSKQTVSEMIKCATNCSGTSRTSVPCILNLKVSDVCVFVREMRKSKLQQRRHYAHHKQNSNSNKCITNCEVFLGGSCNPTTWRADTAIPELKKHGISYYNPQVSIWAPELVAKEHDAKQAASLLLFVVDSQTRSVAGMIEVAYLVAGGRCVVLVAYPYRAGQSIMGESISYREYLDLVNGQTSLLALVKSHGIKVHNNLSQALQCTTHILRNSTKINGLTAEEQVVMKLRKLREVFDSFDATHTGNLNLSVALSAYRHLTGVQLNINDLYRYLNATSACYTASSSPSSLTDGATTNNTTSAIVPTTTTTHNNNNVTNTRISFEQFCALVAEFHDEVANGNVNATGGGSGTVAAVSGDSSSESGDQYNHKHDWASKHTLRHLPSLDNNNTAQMTTAVVRNINGCNYINGNPQQSQQQQSISPPNNNNNNNNNATNTNGVIYDTDVYLGGSCKPQSATWRENYAIPLLRKHRLSFYNPADTEVCKLSELNPSSSVNTSSTVSMTRESSVLGWKQAMEHSRVLVFVVGADTRALTTMVLAAYYIGLDREVVLCIEQLPADDSSAVIDDEILTKQAIKDYNRGRVYLSDLAKRKQVPVFDNIAETMDCVINKCNNATR